MQRGPMCVCVSCLVLFLSPLEAHSRMPPDRRGVVSNRTKLEWFEFNEAEHGRISRKKPGRVFQKRGLSVRPLVRPLIFLAYDGSVCVLQSQYLCDEMCMAIGFPLKKVHGRAR